MSLVDAGVLAGTVSTTLFVLGFLPMLIKARRTRDLGSYSPGNLLITNLGNAVHSVYIFSLPVGPIWALHTFYLLSTAAMLWWWWRFHGRQGAPSEGTPAIGGQAPRSP
ncbi:MAG: hypothetical protein ACRDO4_12985 [Nocardioides sp.]